MTHDYEAKKPIPLSAGKLRSIRNALKRKQHVELADFLKELLEQNQVVADLVPDMAMAVNSTECITPELLAKLIVRTRSVILYESCRARFDNSQEHLIDVMSVIQTPEIETSVCKFLTDKFATDGIAMLRFTRAVDVLAENGTQEGLETLEAIEDELQGMAATVNAGADARSGANIYHIRPNTLPLHNWNASLHNQQLEHVRNGIQKLQDRLAASVHAPASRGQFIDARKSFQRCANSRRSAHEQLMLRQYKESVNWCRQSAEACCKAVLQAAKAKDIGDKTLDPLRNALHGMDKAAVSEEDRLLPNSVDTHIQLIQKYGNYGSHDQIDESSELTEDMVRGCLSHTEAVEQWAINKVARLEMSND